MTATDGRHHHAVGLVDAGAVEVVEKSARSAVVEVISRSDHGIRRRVTSENGRWCCDCPAFRHGHTCAYVAAADLVTAPAGRLRRLPPADATATRTEALPWD